MSKLKILLFVVLSVIIGSAIAIVVIQNISKENPEQEQVQQTTKEEKKVPTETQERVVITEDDRSHNEALSAIEMPGHKVEPSIEKEVKEAFKVVIKECKTANI